MSMRSAHYSNILSSILKSPGGFKVEQASKKKASRGKQAGRQAGRPGGSCKQASKKESKHGAMTWRGFF